MKPFVRRSLMKKGPDEHVGRVVALVGEGPYAQIAARRALQAAIGGPRGGMCYPLDVSPG